VRDLVSRYGVESFDLVISTELVEHVRDWRDAFWNMKSVLRPGGAIIVTTRSPGFAVHAYPFDFWRYTREDMHAIFADFERLELGDDRIAPGVFAIARKPTDWQPADLRGHPLYAVATRSRIVALSWNRELAFRASHFAHTAYRRLLPKKTPTTIK
jgi:SAM-dependent methyltransferase